MDIFEYNCVKSLELEQDKAIPDPVRSCYSMMSRDERVLLYSLAKHAFSGEGAIVDAGVFLGGSTICFGQGVKDGGRAPAEPVVHVFDRARVTPGMMRFFQRKQIHPGLKLEDSLEGIIRAAAAPYDGLVAWHFGDVLEHQWPEDRAIEICFLDILKTYEVARHCTGMFFGALVPNKSIVVQQDYFYEELPYVKVIQEHYADCFEYLGEIRTTAVFRATAKVPAARLGRDLFAELPGARDHPAARSGRHPLRRPGAAPALRLVGRPAAGRAARPARGAGGAGRCPRRLRRHPRDLGARAQDHPQARGHAQVSPHARPGGAPPPAPKVPRPLTLSKAKGFHSPALRAKVWNGSAAD